MSRKGKLKGRFTQKQYPLTSMIKQEVIQLAIQYNL